MEFKLFVPQYIDNSKDCIIPAAEQAGSDDRIFIACSDLIVAQSLSDYITQNFDVTKPVTPENFNDALDFALNTEGHSVKKCDLAFMMFHRGGCLVAQMGDGRALHVRPADNQIVYDSRNQILDIYSAKAMVQQITDILADDYFIISTLDKFDVRSILKTLSDKTLSDGVKRDAIASATTDAQTHKSPSIYINHVNEVSGHAALMTLRDLNWRWYILFIVIFIAIIITAVYSFKGNSPEKIDSPQATVQAVDTDSVVPVEVLPPETTQPQATQDSVSNTVHRHDTTVQNQEAKPAREENSEPATEDTKAKSKEPAEPEPAAPDEPSGN